MLVWAAGIVLGLVLGAAQIIPLGYYLAKSPVWGDRRRATKAWWVLSRPRLPDVVCTAFPYMYGSQRRGHPNLARGLGVHNLNESAGGYAGLATLIWLAPLALGQRGRRPEVGFLVALGVVGAMAAFRLFPVDNLLRALPVLDVTDNRRLSLWIAFSLSLLGAFGIDGLARGEHLARSWIAAWLVGAGLLGGIAIVVPRLEPLLRQQAESITATPPGSHRNPTWRSTRRVASGRSGRHWRSCLVTTVWQPASCLRWLFWPCCQRGKSGAWRVGFLPY